MKEYLYNQCVIEKASGSKSTDHECRFQAQGSLLPLIEAHEELVEDLRRYLYHLAPSPK